jgi:hypothetical protein
MPALYDPAVIQKFADRLYTRAISAIVGSVLGGIILGVGCGVLVYILTDETMRWGLIAGVVGVILFGLLGLLVGLERSFMLRLQAQTALCQMRIEANTRGQ